MFFMYKMMKRNNFVITKSMFLTEAQEQPRSTYKPPVIRSHNNLFSLAYSLSDTLFGDLRLHSISIREVPASNLFTNKMFVAVSTCPLKNT